MNKWVWIGLGIAAFVAFLAWLFIESSKPLPGEKVADLGRKHVPAGTKVEYNSSPPTSGDHYDDWVRSGVYETPKEEGNLVHSLEHGYAIMSYNCDVAKSKVKSQKSKLMEVYAHGIEEEASQSTQESSPSATLPDTFRSDDCHKLVDQFISIYEKKGKVRLIVVPRLNMDSRIALTAWNYIDKFDSFDQDRIEKFIDAHLNQGPEKTME